MRLLVWCLGVATTLGDMMLAYNVAPRWVWVWWVWLSLWVLAGAVVLTVALVRAVAFGRGRSAPHVPAPPVTAAMRDQGRE